MNAVNATLELRDIRGPVALPGEWLWLWILLGCLLVAVVAMFLRRFLNRKKAAPALPLIPAWEVALKALDELAQGSLVAQGKVKEYYSELSGIVRRYIEERLEVRAPEMTTKEFMDALRYSDKLSAAQQKYLGDFLNASDMVKFAKFIPSAEEMHQGLKLARTFVEETR